jgi:hypothetical protein
LNLEAWSIQVKREKGVYYTLNKFSVDVTRKVRDLQTRCTVHTKDKTF